MEFHDMAIVLLGVFSGILVVAPVLVLLAIHYDLPKGAPKLEEDVSLPPLWGNFNMDIKRASNYFRNYGTSSSQHTVMRGRTKNAHRR